MADALEEKMEAALREAVEAAGGQNAIAKKLGTKQSTVWGWIHQLKKAPAEKVVDIEHACDGRVTRHQLRPDIFDAPPPIKARDNDPSRDNEEATA